MQLINATPGQGSSFLTSANTTWAYPFAPGDSPGGPSAGASKGTLLRLGFAACIPSNITISSACCTAANGSFITNTIQNLRDLNSTELSSILNAKYPDRNNSESLIGGAPTTKGLYAVGITRQRPMQAIAKQDSTGVYFPICHYPLPRYEITPQSDSNLDLTLEVPPKAY